VQDADEVEAYRVSFGFSISPFGSSANATLRYEIQKVDITVLLDVKEMASPNKSSAD
jgi:hypothetical protein